MKKHDIFVDLKLTQSQTVTSHSPSFIPNVLINVIMLLTFWRECACFVYLILYYIIGTYLNSWMKELGS